MERLRHWEIHSHGGNDKGAQARRGTDNWRETKTADYRTHCLEIADEKHGERTHCNIARLFTKPIQDQKHEESKKMKHFKVALFIALMLATTVALSACSNRSSYDLHNADGSLNMQYIQDMNDYFEKHPEKLP